MESALEVWSGKRDLNPRPSPWQGDALPLSYSRSLCNTLIGLASDLRTFSELSEANLPTVT